MLLKWTERSWQLLSLGSSRFHSQALFGFNDLTALSQSQVVEFYYESSFKT